jgi:hypothetical protein
MATFKRWTAHYGLLALILIINLATFATSAVGAWSSDFNLPGLAGLQVEVKALAMYQGDLIVAGNFGFAEGVAVEQIARWDGSQWHPLGDGVAATVTAMTEYNGALIVGGLFTWAGGQEVGYIAAWDGSGWSSLGTGLSGPALALAVYNGKLVVGGSFRDAGNLEDAYSLATWDGSSWGSLDIFGGGVGPNGQVKEFCLYEGDLIIAGDFSELPFGYDGSTPMQPLPVANIARFDGTFYNTLGQGIYSWVSALVDYDGQLLASYAVSQDGYKIVRWDGSTWSNCIWGRGEVNTMQVSGSTLNVGGNFTNIGGLEAPGIAAWDGSTWTAYGEGVGNHWFFAAPRVRAILDTPEGLVIGGWFFHAEDQVVNHIARWDGADWSPLASQPPMVTLAGLDEQVFDLIEHNGQIVACGYFTHSHGQTLQQLAAWDGSAWAPIGGGIPDGYRGFALASYGGDLIVAGHIFEIAGMEAHGVVRWDGEEWHNLGEGLSNVAYDMRAHDGLLYVGGDYNTAGGLLAHNIAAWDGDAWSSLDVGLDGPVRVLGEFQGDLIAGGNFGATTDGTPLNHIGRWNGSTWSAFGAGFDQGAVYGLGVYGGELVACGDFDSSGGTPCANIACWDGTQWQPLGDGLDASATALAVYNGRLFVAGSFHSAGGVPATTLIAAWDGSQWYDVGGGLSLGDNPENGQAFLAHDGALYVGGDFRRAGDTMSFGIATWREALTAVEDPTAAAPGLRTASYPNPFNPATRIDVDLPSDGPVSLHILDSRGRVIRRLLDNAWRTAGGMQAVWDGRDDTGRLVASGVYLYEVKAGTRAAARKLVLVK